MANFFQTRYTELVDSPNGEFWWHSLPLPDGRRINGANVDKDHQFLMWEALQIDSNGGLRGKSVLDIGANDGFFSLAALAAGARSVTSVNTCDWKTWPRNIEYAARTWGLQPEIVTADFRTHHFAGPFDVVFFFGVLYHLEDVFGCMRRLRELVVDNGVIYMETAVSLQPGTVPMFEYASDVFPTLARQDKRALGGVGISNYLFPNVPAIENLAYSYDFDLVSLNGPHNRYTQRNASRHFYKMTKARHVEARVA